MRTKVWLSLCWLSLVLAVGQVVLVLLSWLWAAALPDSTVSSLLSPSGLRWFFGRFVANELSPALMWLLLAGMAAGSLRSSGVVSACWQWLRHGARAPLTSLQLFAVRSSLALLMAEVGAVALLTVPSHALLLSVTGELWPSSFSVALVPVVAFVCITVSVFYGLLARVYRSLASIADGLCSESRLLVLLVLVYVLASQLVCSVIYVFGLVTP